MIVSHTTVVCHYKREYLYQVIIIKDLFFFNAIKLL